MIAALFGITYALVLQQGDVFRQHIHYEPVVVYAGQEASSDPSSWLYSNRQSGFAAVCKGWQNEEQYGV